MKILLVANFKHSIGGISGQVELLHHYLNAEGIEAEIYSTRGSALSRLKMFSHLRNAAAGYDVIHVHCCSMLGFFPAILAISVAKRLKKRIICTYHGGGAEPFFRRFKWLVRHYLCQTDANIVLSGFLVKVFEEFGIPYKMIPNIIQTDGTQFRKRSEIKPKFISVRSLEPVYDIPCIIKAFAIVRREIGDAQLTILGDGRCRKELEKLVEQMQIEGITFVGRVPNESVYDYMGVADVFLSSPKFDNQPMSILEAFKCGLLVISSNVGGVPNMIDEGRNGMMFESGNHKELADKMLWAVRYPAESITMMEAGNRDLHRYKWESVREDLLALYRHTVTN